VADVELNTAFPTETQLLVRTCPDGDDVAVVPVFMVELVAPAAPSQSLFLCGLLFDGHAGGWL
jgi:hypothetical protein